MPPNRVGTVDHPDRLGCRSVAVYQNSVGFFIKPDGAHEKLHGAMRWTTTSGVRMRGRSVYTEPFPGVLAQQGYGDNEDFMSDDGQEEDDEEARQLEEAIQRSLQDVGPAVMPDALDAALVDPAAPAADGEDAGEGAGGDESGPPSGSRNCVICLEENAACMVCQPCFHMVSCQACSRRLQGRPCPMCRRQVTRVTRVFF